MKNTNDLMRQERILWEAKSFREICTENLNNHQKIGGFALRIMQSHLYD